MASDGVQFAKILVTSTTTKMPTTSTVTWNEGVNAPGGSYEYLMLRGDCTWNTGTPTTSDMTSLLSSKRNIINGEMVHDFRAGHTANDKETSGNYGYFLNSVGGRAHQVVSGTTTQEWYWAIPIGRTYTKDIVRIEFIIEWAEAAQTINAGTLEWWVKTNSDISKSLTVAPATTFLHSANTVEQVVIRVPQNTPAGSVVSAIGVFNNSANDYLGTQGIRINSMSSFGMEQSMLRFLNGDMANGIMFADSGDSTTSLQYSTELAGCTVIPVFGLVGGDVVITVDNTTSCTRRYVPILTSPVGGKGAAEVRQTQRQPSNPAVAIMQPTLDQ